MTKLYNVPRYSIIKLEDEIRVPPEALHLKQGDILKFYHVDGLYSFCKTMDNKLCYLAAYADVSVIGKFKD